MVHSAEDGSIPGSDADPSRVIKVGMRVRLRPETADGWLLPMRDFAKKGREATVTAVGKLSVRVNFDVKRKGARPHVDHCQSVKMFWRDYEPIPNGYEAAGEVSPNLKAKAQGEGNG